MFNFVYLRSSRLKVLHFWLDSCIANKGEKFELEMACWINLEGFQVVSSHFWALVCTGLTGHGHRFDRSVCWLCSHVAHRSDQWCWPVWPVRAELLQLPCFKWCLASIRLGGVALVQGELACVQGELFVVCELWFGGLRSLLEHSFVSDVSSRCPCLRGPRLAFFKWSCSLPLFGFRSLVEVFYVRFFSLHGFVSNATPKKCCKRHKNGSNSNFATNFFWVKCRCTCDCSNSRMQRVTF
jgi:hypothetical protein